MSAPRLLFGLLAFILLLYRGSLAFWAYASPLSAPLAETSRFLFEFACNVWVPFLGIAAGAFISFLRPEDPHARRAALMFFSSSLLLALDPRLLPPALTRAREELSALGGIVALPTSVLWFFLHYPQRSVLDRRAPWLKWLMLVFLVGLYFRAFLPVYGPPLLGQGTTDHLHTFLPKIGPGTPLNLFLFVWISATYVVAMTALVIHGRESPGGDDRRRFWLLFFGTSSGTSPLFLIFLSERLGWDLPMPVMALLVLMLGLFPLTFVYVVATHRVFGLPVLLRRGLQHALLSRGFLVVAFLLLFSAIFAVVRRSIAGGAVERGPAASLLTVALTMAAVLGLQALSRRVLPAIDRQFFREAYDARQVLIGLSRAVRRLAAEPDRLFATVAAQMRQAMHPRSATLFLRSDLDWPGLSTLEDVPGVTLDGRGRFRPVRLQGQQPLPPVRIEEASLGRLAALASETEPRALELSASGKDDPGSLRLIVPLVSSGEMLGLVAIGEKLSEEPYSGEDKDLLLIVAEQVAIALDNLRLAREVADQETLRREVEIAREVQTRLLPRDCPPLRTLACVGSCRPAQGVGGDYYDFLLLGEGQLGLALGDISGKGISAALLMSNLHALLRSHAPLRGTHLELLMRDLSSRLFAATESARYATFFYGVFEVEERRLTYVNAGHIPPVLVRPRGPGAPEVRRLTTGGMVLGLFPEPAYEQETLALHCGDALVVFSDGLSEAENPEGDMLGEERLADVVARNLHLPARELHDRLLEEVAAFGAGYPARDDSTLLVARVL